MTVKEKLQSFLTETYLSEDGDEYRIELRPGLPAAEVDELAKRLPTGEIPADIKELLEFTTGFEFYGIDEVTFDGIGQSGFDNIFPYSVQLAHDGFGNFWILDVDSKGHWGNVFYVCHDPAVVVKHSDDLAQFIDHIHEHGKNPSDSMLNTIHEKTVFDISRHNYGFIELQQARDNGDPVLGSFALSLPDNFVVADLRNKPNGAGFAWGKFGPGIHTSVRCGDELIWGVEKPLKKGFFKKLFG